jgi:hypothetical protein
MNLLIYFTNLNYNSLISYYYFIKAIFNDYFLYMSKQSFLIITNYFTNIFNLIFLFYNFLIIETNQLIKGQILFIFI